MLSAQSTDVQVNKATPALFARYPTVEALAAAGVDDVFPLVKSCGFKSKANNIVEACKAALCCCHGGKVPDTMEALTALPGVGRKTANVVLANAFPGAYHRGGYARVPRYPTAQGLARRKNRRAYRGTADACDSEGGLDCRASLAYLSMAGVCATRASRIAPHARCCPTVATAAGLAAGKNRCPRISKVKMPRAKTSNSKWSESDACGRC